MPLERRQFASFLRDAGYDWQPDAGVLTRDGRSVGAQVALGSAPTRSHAPRMVVSKIRLSVSIELGTGDPLATTAARLPRQLPSPVPAFVPLPGHRATAFVDLDWWKLKTRTRLREALDRFWRETGALGERFSSSGKTDWVGSRFPDDAILAEPDLVQMARLFKAWRWSADEGSAPFEGFEGINGIVDGERILVWVSAGERLFRLAGAFPLPASKPYRAWFARHPDETRDASAPYGDGRLIHLAATLDPSQGVTLGEVRRQVRALAHRTSRLRKLP